ncbi:MAG TPA: carboxypeptidase-like regulatory domain-containing protein [Thermoanaerobaculia bacterium]
MLVTLLLLTMAQAAEPPLPLGELRGRVTLARGETVMPRELTASYDERKARVSTRCAIDTLGEWNCRLPVKVVDVRLEVAGYAPHYVWDALLSPEHAVTVPPFTLTRGASVSGWIASEVRDADLTKATVRLSPLTYGVPADEVRLSSYSAKANRRGFFQFAGVPAGTWRLWAEAPEHSRAEDVELNVGDSGETVSRRTLRLGPLAEIEVAVSPATDPAGRRWELRLLRLDPHARHAAPVAKTAVSADGRWSDKGLEAGSHQVQIVDGAGAVHVSRMVEIEPGMPAVLIAVDTVPVKGRVRIGERGIAARLKFTSSDGERLTATSNEEGEFALALPFEGKWTVAPKLVRNGQSFAEQEVDVRKLEGEARVDLDLPAGRVAGRVVDEAGEPVKAGVIVTRSGTPIADLLADDGSFELVGVEVGAARIEAQAKGRYAAPMTVQINDDTPPVTLVMRPEQKYEVWLSMPSGQPVAGASITYRTAASTMLRRPTSSPMGRFSITPEPGMTAVTMAIADPGLPSKLATVPLGDPAEPINIVLSETGGRLVVPSNRATIRRGAAEASVNSLLPPFYPTAGPPSWLTDEGIVLYVEPGEYSVCAPDCVTRVVAAGRRRTIGPIGPIGRIGPIGQRPPTSVPFVL